MNAMLVNLSLEDSLSWLNFIQMKEILVMLNQMVHQVLTLLRFNQFRMLIDMSWRQMMSWLNGYRFYSTMGVQSSTMIGLWVHIEMKLTQRVSQRLWIVMIPCRPRVQRVLSLQWIILYLDLMSWQFEVSFLRVVPMKLLLGSGCYQLVGKIGGKIL